MKLSTRIALSVAVLVPLLVLGAGTLVVRWARHDLTQRQEQQLQQRAERLAPPARFLARTDLDERQQAIRTRQYRILGLALDVGVRFDTADGPLLVGPQPPEDTPLPARAPSPVTVHAGGRSWRMVTRPLPTGALYVFVPSGEPDAQAALLRRRVYVVTAFTVPLSGLAGLAAGAATTRSLRALRRRAARLDPDGGAHDAVHVPSGVVEVDELGRTLDDVLGRYAAQTARTREALETARSFAATVDHELRGPLTGMRTDLDVLATYPDLVAAEREDVVADLRVGHERVLSVLTALRALAQGDLVDASAFGPVELGEVAHAAVRAAPTRRPGAEEQAAAEAVDVRVEAPHEVVVYGLGPGLRLLVDNLVGNALVHGAGRVLVKVLPGMDCGVVCVDDEGPGIAPELREVVFERFRRGPDSPGAGLGLTLVAQQVALHGGRVTVGVPPSGHGTRIEVVLPLRADPVAARERAWLGIRAPEPTSSPAPRSTDATGGSDTTGVAAGSGTDSVPVGSRPRAGVPKSRATTRRTGKIPSPTARSQETHKERP
ncbi:HAMP domain-containing sensor histidine kinase [Embleya sp. NPDC005971]|uniref:sensor histidine kinase n=1 Tax=unclassified Embleya TaxID=2699296 RepID=UPI00340E6F74